jgi:hypothetical protein
MDHHPQAKRYRHPVLKHYKLLRLSLTALCSLVSGYDCSGVCLSSLVSEEGKKDVTQNQAYRTRKVSQEGSE